MLEAVTKENFIQSSSLLSTGGAKAPQGIASHAVSQIAQAENGTESKGCCNSMISVVKKFFNWILDLLCCRCFRKADDESAKEDRSTVGFMRRDPLGYLTKVKGNIIIRQDQRNDLNVEDHQGMTLLMLLCDSEGREEENPFILQKGDSLFELIAACLDGGAEVTGCDLAFGRSLFHYVHSVEVAELIAKKWRAGDETWHKLLNATSKAGISPLESATDGGKHKLVEWFLKHHVEVLNVKDRVDLSDQARSFNHIEDRQMAEIFVANGRGALLGGKYLFKGETLIHRTLQNILSYSRHREELLDLAAYLINERKVGLDDKFNGTTARELIDKNDRLARFRSR